MERIRFESRSLSSALLTYLQGLGWNVDKIEEAFITDTPLTLPAVSVHFIQSREHERELGRTHKAFKRPVQVDVYMESKQRAQAIIDNIGDFMDEQTITVYDPQDTMHTTLLAYMSCFDTESIILDTLAPIATTPELVRWRGVAKCVYDVDYYV